MTRSCTCVLPNRRMPRSRRDPSTIPTHRSSTAALDDPPGHGVLPGREDQSACMDAGVADAQHGQFHEIPGGAGGLERGDATVRRKFADVEHDHVGTALRGVPDGEVDGGVAGLELVDGQEEAVPDHGGLPSVNDVHGTPTGRKKDVKIPTRRMDVEP